VIDYQDKLQSTRHPRAAHCFPDVAAIAEVMGRRIALAIGRLVSEA